MPDVPPVMKTVLPLSSMGFTLRPHRADVPFFGPLGARYLLEQQAVRRARPPDQPVAPPRVAEVVRSAGDAGDGAPVPADGSFIVEVIEAVVGQLDDAR